MITSPSAQVSSNASEDLNANLTIGNPKMLDMATSGFVLCETGDFYALLFRTVNEMRTYFS